MSINSLCLNSGQEKPGTARWRASLLKSYEKHSDHGNYVSTDYSKTKQLLS